LKGLRIALARWPRARMTRLAGDAAVTLNPTGLAGFGAAFHYEYTPKMANASTKWPGYQI
jgi:hypothetical protein